MSDPTTAPRPRLEEALRELEQIVSDIESGRTGIEEGMEKYRRGSYLIHHCRELLEKAERQLHDLPRTPGEP